MPGPDESLPHHASPLRGLVGGRIRSATSHALRAALARASLRLASLLPFGVLHRLGRWLGGLVLLIPGRARDSTLVNLALCFPELGGSERRRLARRSLAEGITAMLELGPLWHWGRARVLALVREVDG